MDQLNPDLVLQYGYLALVPVLAGAAFGLPLPATLLLIGAGAYASSDQLNLPLLLLVSLASVVVGDTAGYWVGRWAGDAVVSRFGRWLRLSDSQDSFRRWGAPIVFLTRFLIPPLGPPVNLMAGMEHYPFYRFALADVAGEAVWVGLYAGLGYALGFGATALAQQFGDASAVISIIVVAAVLVTLVVRRTRGWPRKAL